MQAWENFIATCATEMGEETVRKWLIPLKVLRFDACNLHLEAKDTFQVTWFEEHIRQKVLNGLFNNNKRRIKVHLAVANASPENKSHKPKLSNTKVEIAKFNLVFDEPDPTLTFPSFIVADSNKLTHKVFSQILKLDEDPKDKTCLSSLTPLYLSGPTGSGKTHLLMAAANELKKQGLRVIYIGAQSFADHVVAAIRAGEMSVFREAYRNSDVLIIDDVHIFSRKGATQEEFFHTFNTLHVEGKQIILSANCTPAELQFIEPRLVSRFEWGIALSLELLSKENMEQMLKDKTVVMDFPLHQRVIDFLLDSFTNPKCLMKALQALILRIHLKKNEQKITSTQLTEGITRQLLQDLLKEQQEAALTPQRIFQHVAEHFGIKVEDILGKAQTRDCVLPRQISMYFCRQELKLPYLKIAELFSKDHSTVISSVKQILKGIASEDQEIAIPCRVITKKMNEVRREPVLECAVETQAMAYA